MNRLEQDALDSLKAREDQRKAWGERAKADYARSQEKATGPTWAPTLTEQEKKEQQKYIKQHGCQF